MASLERSAAQDWIRSHVERAAAIETAREKPWSTVLRVPLHGGVAWFKACAPVQRFEPRLTAALFSRWPDRVPEVIAHDEERAWLLLADAGARIVERGAASDAWLAALPRYAELQRGEAAHADDHLAHGVPDLRLAALPARYEAVFRRDDLPLDDEDLERLWRFAPRFGELCDELMAHRLPETIQHDDLHAANVYAKAGRLRVMDWGDSSIAHPFFSLVVPFRFVEEIDELLLDDPWFTRIRDAYLEPWGRGHEPAFELAIRVGAFAHAIAWTRQRDALPQGEQPGFDRWFRVVLGRAVARTRD